MLEANAVISLIRSLGITARLSFTGIDLSKEMVRIANETSYDDPGTVEVQAVVGDASDLTKLYRASADVIFCTFGLQQLGGRAPHELSNWFKCLSEGGLRIVGLVPMKVEAAVPWNDYVEAGNDLTG